MAEPARSSELGNPGYELFILALSVLSIVNLVLILPFSPLEPQQQDVVLIIDAVLTIVFLGDFAHRLLTAERKSAYLFRGGGWLDLIGSLPLLRVFRIFRVLRVSRLLREFGVGAIVQCWCGNGRRARSTSSPSSSSPSSRRRPSSCFRSKRDHLTRTSRRAETRSGGASSP